MPLLCYLVLTYSFPLQTPFQPTHHLIVLPLAAALASGPLHWPYLLPEILFPMCPHGLLPHPLLVHPDVMSVITSIGEAFPDQTVYLKSVQFSDF